MILKDNNLQIRLISLIGFKAFLIWTSALILILFGFYFTFVPASSADPITDSTASSEDSKNEKSLPKPTTQVAKDSNAIDPILATKITPFFKLYCLNCHNDDKQSAGLSLEDFNTASTFQKERKMWEKIRENLATNLMPPAKKKQPPKNERDAVIQAIEDKLKIDCGLVKNPGAPTIRRLNRAEYTNTIRDLVHVKFQANDDFPTDDVGYGFDNIGDVLSLPPLLLEKYLQAAEKILDDAIVAKPKMPASSKNRFFAQNLRVPRFLLQMSDRRIFINSNEFSPGLNHDFTFEGDYTIRIRAYCEDTEKDFPRMNLKIDNVEQKIFAIEPNNNRPKTYEFSTHLNTGKHSIMVSLANPGVVKTSKGDKKRTLYINMIELEGPFNPKPLDYPLPHKSIMIATPSEKVSPDQAGKQIIQEFAKKAFRRPVAPAEVEKYLKLFRFAQSQKETFDRSIQIALRAILVSPYFLFRIENDSGKPGSNPVNDYELATRLSYFLWSSMPDDTLFRLAEQGKLHDKNTLISQVKRMLKDPKSKALTENFAAQWLQLRTLDTAIPDQATYRSYRSELKPLIVKETEMYFEYILQQNRSVLEFLDSNYTFLNNRLAKFYGIGGVIGDEFKKVELKTDKRGGIVTQASILTLTSNPTRTSPVKRGKWILENILGDPPPPPDPNAGQLDDAKNGVLHGTLRQRMEQHRANPICASCHQKMDPLGFSLENFDGVGSFRLSDAGSNIDSRGELPGGIKFEGAKGLKKVLLSKSEMFRRCLAEKLLTYALGRGLEYYDKCAVEDVVKYLKQNRDEFPSAFVAVVLSEPFLKRQSNRSNDK